MPGGRQCPYCAGNVVSEATGQPIPECPHPADLPPPEVAFGRQQAQDKASLRCLQCSYAWQETDNDVADRVYDESNNDWMMCPNCLAVVTPTGGPAVIDDDDDIQPQKP